jgi:hypothetical protein
MELIGDVGQVEGHFRPLGDDVNHSARCTVRDERA